MKERQTVETTL